MAGIWDFIFGDPDLDSGSTRNGFVSGVLTSAGCVIDGFFGGAGEECSGKGKGDTGGSTGGNDGGNTGGNDGGNTGGNDGGSGSNGGHKDTSYSYKYNTQGEVFEIEITPNDKSVGPCKYEYPMEEESLKQLVAKAAARCFAE